MYHFYINFLRFCITVNAQFAFPDQDLNLFRANNDNETLFLNTIPANELVTTDASSATPILNKNRFRYVSQIPK